MPLDSLSLRLTIVATLLLITQSFRAWAQCTNFEEVCSGNQYERRPVTLRITAPGSYSLSLRYRAGEKPVNAHLIINNTDYPLSLPQTPTYQSAFVARLNLPAGDHPVLLSSGASGGFACFNQLCATPAPTTPTTCSPPPAPAATTSGGEVCAGSSVTLTASGCAGTTTWSTGRMGSRLSVSQAGTYWATCSVSGCTSPASNSITITACGTCVPPAPPSLSASASQLCGGSSVTLTASGCAGTVAWSTGRLGSRLEVSSAGTYWATCSANACTSAPSAPLTLTACTPPTPVCSTPDAPDVNASGSQLCAGSNVTLTASGCAGTVTWSTGQTGSRLEISQAGIYWATCSVGDCTSPSSGLVTVTACVTPVAPPPGSFAYETPTGSDVWNGVDNRIINYLDKPMSPGQIYRQESGQLRLEVRKGYGGSVQLYQKLSNGQWHPLINFYDMGRQSAIGSYGRPQGYDKYWCYDDDSYMDLPAGAPNYGRNTDPSSEYYQYWYVYPTHNWTTGYNPLQAGDDGQNPARYVASGLTSDGWCYTKFQCNNWTTRYDHLLPFYYEQWVKIIGQNKVKVYVRLTNQRSTTIPTMQGFMECPFMMISGKHNFRFYNGSRPWNYEGARVTSGITGNGTHHTLNEFQITEPWYAIETGHDNKLIGLVSNTLYRGNYNQHINENDESEASNPIGYVGGRSYANFGQPEVVYREYSYVLGSEGDIRTEAYSIRGSAVPDFNYAAKKGRLGSQIFDGGYDNGEQFPPTDAGWKITFVGKRDNRSQPFDARPTKILTDYGSWPASGFSTLYIKMKYSAGVPGTSQTQFNVSYLLDGQATDGLPQVTQEEINIRYPRGSRVGLGQSVPLTVINDGQYHTYAVQLPTNSGRVYQLFEIEHANKNERIVPGEQFEVAYIGAINPGGRVAAAPAPEGDETMIVQVYPNPSSETVTVTYRCPVAGEVTYAFVDLNGKVVKSGQMSAKAGANRFEWDGQGGSTGPVAPGVYVLRLNLPTESGPKIVTAKVVRE